MTPESRFLIDTEFIIERAHKTFSGTGLLATEADDRILTFCLARDFLRLRKRLGIRAGALVIGSEARSYAAVGNLEDILCFVQAFGNSLQLRLCKDRFEHC